MTKKKKLVLFTSITAAILAVVLVLTLCLTLIDRGDGQDPIAQYTLNVLTDGGGTARVVDVKDEYSADSEVQVVATPNDGWHFDGWFSPNHYKLSSSPTYTFNMKENTVLQARFSRDEHVVSNSHSESTDILDCPTSMSIVVHSDNDEEYVRNNLAIYDNYFLDENNDLIAGYEEYATVPIGSIAAHGNGYYTVHPVEQYDHGNSYVVKATGDVVILKNTTELLNSQTRTASVNDLLQGVQELGSNELAFVVDNYEHEEIELREDVYVYSYRDNPNVNAAADNIDGWVIERIGEGHSNDESGQGGFITNSITFQRNGRTVTLAPGDVVGFGGELVRKTGLKVKDFTNSVFGTIKTIQELGDSEYPVYFVELVSVEKEEDVFTVLDVYVEEDLDLSEYVNPDDPQLEEAIVNEFYASEDFQRLVAAFMVAGNEYAEDKGYDGSPFLTRSIKDNIKIKPDYDFKDGYLMLILDITLKMDIFPKNPVGANMTLSLHAKLVESLHLKLSFSWVKGALGIKKGLDIRLDEDDKTEFSFDVKVEFGVHPGTYKYILDTDGMKVHNRECSRAEQLVSKEHTNKLLVDLVDEGYSPCSLCLSGDLAQKYEQEGEMSTKEFREYLDDKLSFVNLGKVMDMVKDSLVEHKQEDTQTGITLFEYTTATLVRFKIRVSFQIHLSIQASARYDYIFEHHSSQGVRVTLDGCDTYSKPSDTAQTNELTLLGKMEARVGLRLDATVADTLGILQFGLYGEAGAYFQLTGAAKIGGDGENFTAAYMELGVYYDFGVTYRVFYVIQGSKSIIKKEIPIIQKGFDKAIYGYFYNISEVMLPATEQKKSFNLTELDVLEVRTMNVRALTYGHEKLIPTSSAYVVDMSLTDTTWFTVEGQTIHIREGAPLGQLLETTLILKITAADRAWSNYVAGSAVVALPTVEIKLVTMLNCTDHKYILLAREEATCDTDGHEECFVCSRCRKIFDTNYNEIAERGVIAAVGHDYKPIAAVAARCLETGMTAGTQCTRCYEYGVEPQVIAALGHNEQSTIWTPLRAASCELSGEDSHVCDRCGLVIGFRINLPTGHTVDAEHREGDCVEGVKCTVCHKTLAEGKGHDFVETGSVAASCETDGHVDLSCAKCGANERRTIPATGHAERRPEDIIEAETTYFCETYGELSYACRTCGKHIKEQTAPIGHDMTAWTETKAASCTEDGEESRSCKRTTCNSVETRVIHKHGHVPKADKPDECEICGLPVTSNHTGDHSVESKGLRPATCSEVGYTNGIWCSECNIWLVERDEIPVNRQNHIHLYTIAELSPTCTEKGHSEYQKCQDCGADVGFVEINAKGHDVEYRFATVTCKDAGTIAHYECHNCKKYFLDENATQEISNIYAQPSKEYHKLVSHAGVKCTLNETGTEVIPGYNPYHECTTCGKRYRDGTATEEYVGNGHVHSVNTTRTKIGSCTSFEEYKYECAASDGCPVFTIEVKYDDKAHYYDQDVYYNHWLPDTIRGAAECQFCHSTLGLCYELNADGQSYTVTGIGRASRVEEITIPDTYLGLPVTAIGDSAFRDRATLTKIIIPDTVNVIGNTAFTNCNLQEINLSNVKEIGSDAFRSCGSLRSIKLSANLKEIPANAFSYCNALTTVEIPEGCVAIRKYAFEYCAELTKVTIPKTVTSIEAHAFGHPNGGSKTVTLEYDGTLYDWVHGVIRADRWAGTDVVVSCFDGVVHADGSVEYQFTTRRENGGIVITGLAGSYLASQTNRVKYDVVVPSAMLLSDNGLSMPVIGIDANALQNCNYMRKLELPDTIIYISESMLFGCSGLEELTIPFIGPRAVKSDVEESYSFGYIFGRGSFAGATATKSYHYKNGSTDLEVIMYYVPNGLKRVTVLGSAIVKKAFANCNNIERITLGSGVKQLFTEAFAECTSVKQIIIHSNFGVVLNGAFKGCINLEHIEFNGSVQEIYDHAFDGCTKLNFVKLSNTTKRIGNYAFQGTALQSIVIPESVTNIGVNAFAGCIALNSVTFENPNRWVVNIAPVSSGSVSVTGLSNATTAAQYLRDTYADKYWWVPLQ